MGFEEANIINHIIGDSFFDIGVDLGCGNGILGTVIRDNVGYLIGVDHNQGRLNQAERRGVYDELVLCDIRDYNPPSNTDAVFMVEVIEHIPKAEDQQLLRKLESVPTIILTTPSKFCNFSMKNGHVSHWAAPDFESLGFNALLYNRGNGLQQVVYGKGLIAEKGVQPQVFAQAVLDYQTTQTVKMFVASLTLGTGMILVKIGTAK